MKFLLAIATISAFVLLPSSEVDAASITILSPTSRSNYAPGATFDISGDIGYYWWSEGWPDYVQVIVTDPNNNIVLY